MGKEIVDITGGFEGPEKKLEIDFKPTSCPVGFRRFNAADWQKVLTHVRCTIISSTKNEFFDSYVLSESSLFVYPYKIMVKTCGTTTLLKCLPSLLRYAALVGTTPTFVAFSRKNFHFPDEQPFPHNGFQSEVSYLNSIFPGGRGYEFGSAKSQDKWYLYFADYTEKTKKTDVQDQTFEVIMCDLDEKAMRPFFKTDKFTTSKDVTIATGIADLIPGATTDEFMFDPCGYSVNGLKDESFFTIHVTPEPEFSFVSFETNLALPSYNELLHKIVDIFRPGRFVALVFADQFSVANEFKHDFETLSDYTTCDRFSKEFADYYLTVATMRKKMKPIVESSTIDAPQTITSLVTP